MNSNSYSPPGRIISLLKGYLQSPPWVLIFEGATQEERYGASLYWTCMINCPSPDPPCMECSTCLDIKKERHPDIYILGREGKSIKLDEVEVIRRNMPEKPREGRFKVFVFFKGENLTPAASNFLLKSLEEPIEGNLFVILTPHRGLLLPTILSRGQVLSIGWNGLSLDEEKEIKEAVKIIANFLETNTGLFDLTEKKLDKDFVRAIILSLGRRLVLFLHPSKISLDDPLINIWRKKSLDAQECWRLSLLLQRGEEMLEFNIRPSTILEWLCINISCTINH